MSEYDDLTIYKIKDGKKTKDEKYNRKWKNSIWNEKLWWICFCKKIQDTSEIENLSSNKKSLIGIVIAIVSVVVISIGTVIFIIIKGNKNKI